MLVLFAIYKNIYISKDPVSGFCKSFGCLDDVPNLSRRLVRFLNEHFNDAFEYVIMSGDTDTNLNRFVELAREKGVNVPELHDLTNAAATSIENQIHRIETCVIASHRPPPAACCCSRCLRRHLKN